MSYRLADSLRAGSGRKSFMIKVYMFRTFFLSIIRSFSLYTQQWHMSHRLADSLRAGSGRNSFMIKLYMFRTVRLSIIRSFLLHTQQWYKSYSFDDSLRTGSGRSVLILFASCMTYTIAVCTVKNSWWWTEKMSETCRVLSWKNSVLILLASCQPTCMTYTISVCTVKNSWWLTEELFETCRLLFQKYIWEIGAYTWIY